MMPMLQRNRFLIFSCLAAMAVCSEPSKDVLAIHVLAIDEQPGEILRKAVDECVLIEPGKGVFPKTFQMGGQKHGPLSLRPKTVAVTNAFRISKFEVTQELFQTVTGQNPSRWKGRRNSVESVSYLEAVSFCRLLTGVLRERSLIESTDVVRLPTEEEWEYCCRAGTSTLYSFGDSATADGDTGNVAKRLGEYAWHTGNAAGNDPVVGSLKPNPWGLYDMHGYLSEYVSTPLEATSEENATGSTPQTLNSLRILRGGSWRDHYSLLTSAARSAIPDHAASDAIGFRIVIAAGK